MKVFHSTPLLHGEGTTGEATQWQGFAAQDGVLGIVIYAEFGRVGGTIQQAKPSRIEAKNVGRSNETGLEAQAISEIDAKCLLKQKKGYKPVGVAASAAMTQHQERVLPMLAPSQVWPAHASNLRWPLLGQPKLDGMRLVTDGEDFWARTGNLQNAETVKHLRHDTKGLLIDGEVLLPPDGNSFQESMSAMKDAKHSARTSLVYCVFDIVDLKLTNAERYAVLEQFMKDNPHPSWALVATLELHTEADMKTFYRACLDKGMEGIMLRNKLGRYRPKARSMDLQKYKPIDDDEFEIVGYKEATGGWAGTPVFELVIHEGHKAGFDGKFGKVGVKFEAKPAFPLKDAQAMWKVIDTYIGQWGTVMYQGFYDQTPGKPDAGKPRFPRVKGFRPQDDR